MEEYIETKEVYTIDRQDYTVISRTNKKENIEELYDILSRYALKEIK